MKGNRIIVFSLFAGEGYDADVLAARPEGGSASARVHQSHRERRLPTVMRERGVTSAGEGGEGVSAPVPNASRGPLTRGGSRLLVRGASGVLTSGGDLSQKFVQNCLKTA